MLEHVLKYLNHSRMPCLQDFQWRAVGLGCSGTLVARGTWVPTSLAQPRQAGSLVVTASRDGTARLRYHGDFSWNHNQMQ